MKQHKFVRDRLGTAVCIEPCSACGARKVEPTHCTGKGLGWTCRRCGSDQGTSNYVAHLPHINEARDPSGARSSSAEDRKCDGPDPYYMIGRSLP